MSERLELDQVRRVHVSGLRGGLRRRLLERAFGRAAELEDESLLRPAVVIAPHFDDETLGCGGTLLRMHACGTPRHVIFLTDGAVSHRDWIDPVSLRRSREAEGHAAGARLGLLPEQVHCLGYPETDLFDHVDRAAAQVAEILQQVRPGLVFLPYRHEPPADHRAAYEIGIRALQTLSGPVDVLEYPIWVWDAWPFTSFTWQPIGRVHRRMQENWRLVRWTLRDMRTRVSVADVLQAKLAALNEHRTQVLRPNGQPDWPTLGDVKGGEFLGLFFEPFELFHRTTLRNAGPLPGEGE